MKSSEFEHPIKTPYAHLVPPLPEESRRALAVDLAENGQRDDIVLDECGNILDGHHRHTLLGDKVRFRVMHGLTEAEKKAFVVRAANVQRVMTPAQRREFLASVKPLAFELRQEDPRKNTQQRIADKFGVDRSTVSRWFSEPTTNVIDHNGSQERLDARVKYAPEQRAEVATRLESGDSHSAVAASTGIPKSTVTKIARSKPVAAPPKHRKSKTRPPELVEREATVLEFHNQGLGTMEIAKRLDISPSLISRAKLELGLIVQKGAAAAKAEAKSEAQAKAWEAKLWSDVDHVTASLEGISMKIEELTGKLRSTELSGHEKEIKQCIKSLSETARTVNQLRSALKQKLP